MSNIGTPIAHADWSATTLPLDLREASQAAVASGLSAGVLVLDAELRVAQAVGEAFTQHGHEPDRWLGRALGEILPADDWEELEPRYRAAQAGHQQSFDHWTRDGQNAYWVQISPCRRDGEVTSIVVVMKDITERLRTSLKLARSEARLRDSELMIGIGSWELTLSDQTVTYSDGLARLIGIEVGEPLDFDRCIGLVHPDDQATVLDALAQSHEHGSSSCEFRIMRSDGTQRTLALRAQAVAGQNGSPWLVRGAVLDVTEQRELERERLATLALFRQGFEAAPIGMVFSHPDSGLCLRVNDALCRMLGRTREELTSLTIDQITHPEDRAALNQSRRALLDGRLDEWETEKRYLRHDGSELWSTLHVAPVYNPDGSIQAFFSQIVDITHRKEHESRLERYVMDAIWLGRIRDAIDEDRLVLYSQPIVDLRTGEAIQRELLLRMRDSDGSIIPPGSFLGIAERYGLINEIDRWVIRQAVRLAADGAPTEFNLSAASISDPRILDELASEIERNGVDPALLVIELTETAMIEDPAAGYEFAKQVAALGCSLALDDFGTGFAGLSNLKHIPADHLKIDMEFVRGLESDKANQKLVRGIVGFAHEFGQTTTAEGIEDEATVATLRELGVHRGQGYLFGRPSPLMAPLQPIEPPRAKSPGRCDPISVVRAAFDAFTRRDLHALSQISHPDVVIRPSHTAKLAGRENAYRGHDGLRAYLDDVQQLWRELSLTPTAFWNTDEGIIAFGRAVGERNGQTHTADVLWVCRVQDGQLSAIDAFQDRVEGPQPLLTSPTGQARESSGAARAVRT